jgi:hypothetical protein
MTKSNNKRRNNNRSNPVSYNAKLAPTKPLVQQRIYSGKDLIVTNVQGVTPFGSSDYSINPRLVDKFPSASLTAQRYDMYQFDELVFRFHPTTAVTTTKGVLILGWEPNANRGPPDTISQVNAFEHHAEGPIYSPNIILRVPKASLGGPRYCRSGPTMSDLNLYDCGKLIVASDDVTGSEGGYVEVSYKIRFFNYHLEEGTAVQNRVAHAILIGGPQTISASGISEPVIFNSLTEDFGGDDTVALNSGELLLPKGKYLVHAQLSCKNSVAEEFTASVEVTFNGAILSPRSYGINMTAAPVGLPELNVTAVAIVESDGTDTVGALAYLLGATGTLTVTDGVSRLTVTALS